MNKLNKIILWLVAIIIIVGLIWLGYSKREVVEGETIKIGAILMLSGVGSPQGEQSRMGAELAIKEINEKGGVLGKKLEIVFEDDQSDNSVEAISAFRKLSFEGIKIILGTNWSMAAQALAPITCQEKTILISPSVGVSNFAKTCEYIFNLWSSDAKNSEVLGKFIVEKGYKNVAIIGSEQVWEKEQALAVKKGIEENGGQISKLIITKADEKDFRTDILKIKESNPEALVFANYTHEALAAIRAKELGLDIPFFSVLMDNKRVEDSKGSFEGTIIVSSFSPAKDFVEKFEKEYNKKPELSSDTSYDAVKIIAEAIEETKGVDIEKIKEYLMNKKENIGATGKLYFDEFGQAYKDPVFLIVKNGEIIPYEIQQ